MRSLSGADVITTIAGRGTSGFFGDSGDATLARLSFPHGVAVDASGNVYIADSSNKRIRMVSSGTISTVAGDGVSGYTGDGGLATSARLKDPYGVAVDASGNVYIADTSSHCIRKVTNPGSLGRISTVAGNGVSGYTGDGGLATSAKLHFPFCVAVDASGNVYIADSSNHCIRKVTNPGSLGRISTVAGNGVSGYTGDGGLATSAKLHFPYGVAVDASGNVYFADSSNHCIRKVTNPGSLGRISTVAGNGTVGFSGDGGLAISARLGTPLGLCLDALRNIYIADFVNHRVRKVEIRSSPPSPSPTASPSSSPTESPSSSPTALPSPSPTVSPVFPTPSSETMSPISPTRRPSKMPVTAKPTKMPVTAKPTKMPVTAKPTKMPVMC